MSDSKKSALAEIQNIVNAHHISKTEILSLYPNTASTLVRIVTFIAGLLLVVGLVFAAVQFWYDLNVVQQLLLTMGAGVTAFATALLLSRDDYVDSAGLIVSLIIVSILLEPLGFGVAVYHYLGQDFLEENSRLLLQVLLGGMGVQFAVAAYFQRHVKILAPVSMAVFTLLALVSLNLNHAFFDPVANADAVKIALISFVLLVSSLVYENRQGYNPWMALNYTVSIILLVFACVELFDVSETVACVIALSVSLTGLALGYVVNRRALIWPASCIAIVSFISLIFDVVEMGIATSLLMALVGFSILMYFYFVTKRKRLQNKNFDE
tara:strand:- start:4343 stop:5314 length:972 start_codon:yes stop_codon:yes gene_type:complete